MHSCHNDLLAAIEALAGDPVHDDFLKNYLGNDHVRYDLNTPTLRSIAKQWIAEHRDVPPDELAAIITSLVSGKSSTEKIMAGIILGYSSKGQRGFDPMIYDLWLNYLVGWVEVDAVCSGDFPRTQLPVDWPRWKKLITKLSKSPNINKRRAALVLFCSPVTRVRDERIATAAFEIVDRLKAEKEVIITKAISWVLRSLIKNHKTAVASYIETNADTLPRIAVRETRAKLG